MDAIITAILLGLLLILLYKYLTAPNRYWEKLGIPSIEETSYLDSVLESFNTHAPELDVKRIKKHGRVYGHFVTGQPNLMIADPSLLRDILVKDFQNFRNTQDVSPVTSKNDLLNYMLFILQDDKWKRVRTIISPVFSTGKIKKVLPYISESSKTLLKNLRKAAENGKGIDIKKYFEAFSMDLIAQAAFATKIDSHNDPQSPFEVNARKFFDSSINWRFLLFILCPSLFKYFSISLLDENATNFFKNVVLKIMKERKKDNRKYNDFLQLMMDASADAADVQAVEDDKVSKTSEGTETTNPPKVNKVLSPDELMANSIMFFFVGFGTISQTLSFVAYLLAINPECQEKLVEEIDQAIRANGSELSYDTIQSMKYMDMVLSETLRVYPIAPRTLRLSESEYTLKGYGMNVPKKTAISIPVYAIHHDPEFYPDPEKFDPNRFSPEESAKRDPYTYLPFGAGPRNCIGMRFALFEMKTCLAYVLSHFRFRRCSETKVPLNMIARPQTVMSSEDIILLMEERKDKTIQETNY